MDNAIKKHGFLICSIASIIIGAVIFVCLFGYRVLNTFYVDWIFNSNIDMNLYYLGWNYFQHAPWSFPLGVFDNLSYPIKTSILSTDSIPLFAIFFKLFKNILPDDFQYLGLYSLICYMFQSFFGMAIVRRFTKNDILGDLISILAGLFFVLIPILVVRTLNQSVTALHCILLACFIPIIYNFKLKQKLLYYSIVGLLGGFISPYAVVIPGFVLFVYCIYQYSNKKNIKEILPIVLYLISAFAALYFVGAFIGTMNPESYGRTYASFNLNGFFNSFEETRFFNHQQCVTQNQIEGYAYFGAGILALIAITLYDIAIRYLQDRFVVKNKKEVLYIVILIIASIVLAMSPRVTYSNIVLFDIPYPYFIRKFWLIFNSAGRFVYIVNYTILILVLSYIIKNFPKKKCLIVLVICIGLQIADIVPSSRGDIVNFTMQRRENKEIIIKYNDTHGEFWNSIFSKNNIKNIYADTTTHKAFCSYDFLVNTALWARNRNIKLNDFYYARPIKNQNEIFLNKLKNPDNEDIFVFYKIMPSKELILSSSLKHFYSYAGIILGSKTELNGLEDVEISKEDVINENYN